MIYDCFCYNGEEDMLEIRFNILDQYVDKFIIGDAPETFSGKRKPIYHPRSNPRFKKWKEKMFEINPPAKDTDDPFVRSAFQKDYLRYALRDCEPDDVIYFGDVDEIWKPQQKEGKLRQINYSYYLNNRSSEVWEGTNVFKYKNIRNLNDIRADHSVVLEDGGWHFTNVGGYNAVMKKIQSYDHAHEVNIPYVTDNLKDRMETNQDFLGRETDWQGKPFTFWKDESQLPQYLLDNKDKYKHLWKS